MTAQEDVDGLACVRCRGRKSKCDKARPKCATCVRRRAKCEYPKGQKKKKTAMRADPAASRNAFDPAVPSDTKGSIEFHDGLFERDTTSGGSSYVNTTYVVPLTIGMFDDQSTQNKDPASSQKTMISQCNGDGSRQWTDSDHPRQVLHIFLCLDGV